MRPSQAFSYWKNKGYFDSPLDSDLFDKIKITCCNATVFALPAALTNSLGSPTVGQPWVLAYRFYRGVRPFAVAAVTFPLVNYMLHNYKPDGFNSRALTAISAGAAGFLSCYHFQVVGAPWFAAAVFACTAITVQSFKEGLCAPKRPVVGYEAISYTSPYRYNYGQPVVGENSLRDGSVMGEEFLRLDQQHLRYENRP